MRLILMFLITALLCAAPGSAVCGTAAPETLEQAMSDTLDLWREGRFGPLFDRLAHRGRTSREQFIRIMTETAVRPACCFQKLQQFRVLNEKRTEATVYATVGLEGGQGSPGSCSREFRLTHEEQVWKMQLADVLSISGASKGKHAGRKARRN